MSAEIVVIDPTGSPSTTSLIIADGTDNDHASVLRLVRDNILDFEEFGLVGFEIRPRPEGQHGGGTVQYAVLNEEQATLLMTYMRNSDVVKDFKKKLVRAFFALRQATPVIPDITTPEGVLALTEMFGQTARELVAATAEKKMLEAAIERDAPLVAKAEAHTVSDSAIHRQEFAREVKTWAQKQNVVILQDEVMRFLSHIGLFIKGDRSDTGHATSEAIRRGLAFTDKGTSKKNGHAYAVGKLTPAGQDYAWKRITKYVAEHGHLVLPRELRTGETA